MPAGVADAQDAAVAAARDAGVAIEVSSAGLRKTVGEEYPAPPLLESLVDGRRPDRLLVGRARAGGSRLGAREDRSRRARGGRERAFEFSEERETKTPSLGKSPGLPSETSSTENVGVIVSFSVARRQGHRSFSIRAATRSQIHRARFSAVGTRVANSGISSLRFRWSSGRSTSSLRMRSRSVRFTIIGRIGVGRARHGHLERVVVAVARGVRRVSVRRAVPLLAHLRVEKAMRRVEVDRARKEQHRAGL